MTDGPTNRTRRNPEEITPSAPSQVSRPPSAEPVDDQAKSVGENESFRKDEHESLRAKLSSIITDYREHKISKSRAISGVSTLIDDHPNLSEIEKEKAIDLYVDEISSINRDNGPEFIAPKSQKEKAIDKSVHDFLDQISNRVRGKGDDDSSGSDSDDADEPPRKKKKVKESDMGWYDPNDRSPYSEDVSCRKTCERLQVYNRDIAGSKFLAKLSRHAPPGIPSSQWERIFRGEALDLDHFLSSLHRTTINEEGETCIGNAKISLGVADAKRHVSSAAEWSSAWRLAARATAFAFPHRTEELQAYGDFIESEFSGKLPSSHPRVILFDIAIRNIVQGGHNTLLTDRALHLRFYSVILMPDGVGGNTSTGANRRSGQPRTGGSKTDICNRFNTSGGCPSADSECKYWHICKNCKKGGHGKDQCPK
jgi:hypothetical protein